MITNPIGKTEGAGVGGISFPFVLRPEKILEIRFIDSCLQLNSLHNI